MLVFDDGSRSVAMIVPEIPQNRATVFAALSKTSTACRTKALRFRRYGFNWPRIRPLPTTSVGR